MPLLEPVSLSFPFHPLLLLVLALLAEPVLGKARGPIRLLPHPVRLIGFVVGTLDRQLNRPERGAGDRRLRGMLVVLFVCAVSAGIGAGVNGLARTVPFGWLAELALIISLLAQRSLFSHVRQVGLALQDGLDTGRAQVAHIVGRDVRQLDAHGVARAAIESCAENFSDAVVAPVFWFVLLGLPGMLVYKAVNTMDSMIGHRSERYLAFGWAAARLDDALNLLPARAAGALLGIGAVAVPGASARRALRTMLRDARLHRSPNAGWPEAAMAGALGLSLAGPRRYPGLLVDDPWIGGDGTAQATPRDVFRAVYLFTAACTLNACATALLAAAKMMAA